MLRILIVDDEAVNRELLAAMLKSTAACDTAPNGQKGLDLYQKSIRDKNPYQVILLDITMPELDGMEVLRRVREEGEKRGKRIRSPRGVIVRSILLRPPHYSPRRRESTCCHSS